MTIKSSNEILETFPTELLIPIFSHLSPKDLLRCSQVNKIWRLIANDFLGKLENPRGAHYPVYTRIELMEKIRQVVQRLECNQILHLYIRPFRKKGTPQLFLDKTLLVHARSPHCDWEEPHDIDFRFPVMLDEICPTIIEGGIVNRSRFQGEVFPNYECVSEQRTSMNVCKDLGMEIDGVFEQRKDELIESFIQSIESIVDSKKNTLKNIAFIASMVTVMAIVLYLLLWIHPNSLKSSVAIS